MRNNPQVLALYQNKLFLLFEVFILIILPLNLIYVNPAVIHTRTFIMTAGLTYVYFVMRTLNLSWQDLGFTKVNLIPALLAIAPPLSWRSLASRHFTSLHLTPL